MPEGDTIYRTAVALRPALEGRSIARATVRDRQFEPDRLAGVTIVSVEARGKHLLIHVHKAGDSIAADRTGDTIAGFMCLHSHLGMTGSWHIYRRGEAWQKPAHYAGLVLAVDELDVICFSPKLLELLSADQLRHHVHLRRLGPDLLAREFDVAGAVARFRARNDLPLGEAVMNQTIVCGIGNVYKSDLLFLMGFDPFAAVAKFSDEELAALLDRARRLMQRNLSGAPRQTRFRGDGQRLWTYGRAGQTCYKCGAVIQLRRQGDAGRTTCWCPVCQPARL